VVASIYWGGGAVARSVMQGGGVTTVVVKDVGCLNDVILMVGGHNAHI